jgi:predicted ester cyclase
VTTDGMVDLVRRFYKRLWNAWDDDAVEAILAPTFAFRGSLGAETQGWEGWRAYRDQVRNGSPDFRNQVIDMVCENDRAAVRLECSGHHLGPLIGIEATGRRFRYSAAAFFQAEAGLLTDAWVLGDLDALRGQLTGPRI